MPVGIVHEDKVKAIAKQHRLSKRNMPEAIRYFHRLTKEKEAAAVAEKTNNMPTAIHHFTLAHRIER